MIGTMKEKFQSLKTKRMRALQSNSRTRCLHEGKYWKPKWIHQSSLSTVIWHNYAFCSPLEQHNIALVLTKTKVRGEQCRSLKIITYLVKIHKTEDLGQARYDNKLFPCAQEMLYFCQFINLPAFCFMRKLISQKCIQLSADALHVQTRLSMFLRQHICLSLKINVLTEKHKQTSLL